jgi:hypothetical protein
MQLLFGYLLQNETLDDCHTHLSMRELWVEQLQTHMNTGWKKQDTGPLLPRCAHDVAWMSRTVYMDEIHA